MLEIRKKENKLLLIYVQDFGTSANYSAASAAQQLQQRQSCSGNDYLIIASTFQR